MTEAEAAQTQAWASVAAVIVAAIALVIAFLALVAAWWQARSAASALAEAKRQADAADRSEQARRWDERVQAVRPVLVKRPGGLGMEQAGVNAGQAVQVIHVTAPDVPVLDLRTILRRGPDNGPDVAIGGVYTLAPSEPFGVRLVVTNLWRAALEADADLTPYRLHLNWTGQLGQWVTQEWDYDFVAQARGDGGEFTWRMVRWTVDPKVEGLDPLVVEFG